MKIASKKTPLWARIAAILTVSCMLCFLAVYNGFPLVFNNDTGMYLENAYDWYVSVDRPATYGQFLFFGSLSYSLWLIVWLQAWMIAWLTYCWFYYWSEARRLLLNYLLFSILAAAGTACSFTASWLIPDIFTPVVLLSAGLLLFARRMRANHALLAGLLLVAGVSMHNSNFLVCITLITALAALRLLPFVGRILQAAGFRWHNLIVAAMLAITGYLAMGGVHYLIDGQFRTTRGGSVFVLSNLVETGLVERYLDEHCEENAYRLCEYRDSLPNNFLWAGNSPLHKMGGWEASRHEFDSIIFNMVSSPYYLSRISGKSAGFTLKQFFNFDMVDIGRPSERIVNAVKDHYIQELPQMLSGRENKDALDVGLMNFIQEILLFARLVAYCCCLIGGRGPVVLRALMIFTVLALLANAWVCGTFSGVFPRYQGRVAWLLLLPPMLFLPVSRFPFFRIRRKNSNYSSIPSPVYSDNNA